ELAQRRIDARLPQAQRTRARPPSWEKVQMLALTLDVEPNEFRDPSLTLPTPAAPRARGRPRKPPEGANPQPKRPRGRPRKAPAASQDTTERSKARSAPSGQEKPPTGQPRKRKRKEE